MIEYDLVIIGGGPAGLMSAGRAGELGARVLVVEKNNKLGVKLLSTGGGRCNISHKPIDLKSLTDNYGKNGKFLLSALHKFGPLELRNFFKQKGVATKIEKDNRIFPVDDKASSILNALLDYMQESGVEIKTNAEVKEIIQSNKNGVCHIDRIILSNKEEISSKHYVFATGGKSFPLTGSTGDGYIWLKQLGHHIVEPKPSIVPIFVKEDFVKEIEGLSSSNAIVNLYSDNKKIISLGGGLIFTSVGLSGPAIKNITRYINTKTIKKLSLRLDFFPDLILSELDKKLQNIFNSTKTFKNSLHGFIMPKLIPVLAQLLSIDIEKNVNTISREQRKFLSRLLKDFRFTIKGLGGYDQAIITAGGVALSEIDPQTMHSKIVDNLSVVGELLDLDGPTGGYNLQMCWSTGYVAGQGAVK